MKTLAISPTVLRGQSQKIAFDRDLGASQGQR